MIRDILLKEFPSLEKDDIQHSDGTGGEDINCLHFARKIDPYQIECKSKARSQIHTYYEQAASHGTYEPLVIVKWIRTFHWLQ